MQKKYRAGGYLRLSDKDSHLDAHEQSESIENQKAIIKSYVKEHPDIELVDFFIDDGFTGLNYDREGFRDLMASIDEGNINMVITKEMSRLGRELVETLQLIKKEFVEKGVRFVAVIERMDSLYGVEDPMVAFKAVMNDEYSRMISNSVTNTLRNLQKQGKYVAAFTPYGYKKDPEDKHHLIVDEETASVVKRIYASYIEGNSIDSICRTLSEEAEISPAEHKRQFTNFKAKKILPSTSYWTYTTVWKILKNEVYLGTVVQHTKEKVAYNLPNFKLVPSEEVIKIPNMHEAIISQEEFDTVQEMMKTKRRDWKSDQDHPNLFAGLIVCGECGRSLGRVQDHDYGRRYYRCNTYARMGKAYCTAHKIYEAPLQDMVLAAVRENAIETEVFQNTKWDPGELYGRNREKNQRLLNKSQESLEKLERERSGMVLKLSKEILTTQDFLLYKEEYEKEKKRLEQKISDLQKQINDDNIINKKYQDWIDEFIVHKELKSLTREIVVNLIKKIVIYENKVVEIQFRFENPFQEI